MVFFVLVLPWRSYVKENLLKHFRLLDFTFFVVALQKHNKAKRTSHRFLRFYRKKSEESCWTCTLLLNINMVEHLVEMVVTLVFECVMRLILV
jgi:hypothetical protein